MMSLETRDSSARKMTLESLFSLKRTLMIKNIGVRSTKDSLKMFSCSLRSNLNVIDSSISRGFGVLGFWGFGVLGFWPVYLSHFVYTMPL